MILVNLDQGSDSWFAEKLGKPSASNINKIITNDGKFSKQREGYLFELAGEILSGKSENGYKNVIMEQGNIREDESRAYLELTQGIELQRTGVIYKDERKRFLCSPDGINEALGFGAELKNPLAKTQVKYLLNGVLPSEYFGQVQMALYITGFNYWWFLSYVPNMTPLLLKVEPDIKYQEALEKELNAFCDELDKIVQKLKG